MSESEISQPESSKTQELKSQKSKTVTLKTSDGEEFSLPVEIAEQSGMIKSVIAEGFSENIFLPFGSGLVFSKLIEFWQNGAKTEQWKERFFMKMEHSLLFEFMHVTNYLDSEDAVDSACRFVADTIKDFSLEKIKDYFEVPNYFTQEEEARIIQKNPWVLEN